MRQLDRTVRTSAVSGTIGTASETPAAAGAPPAHPENVIAKQEIAATAMWALIVPRTIRSSERKWLLR